MSKNVKTSIALLLLLGVVLPFVNVPSASALWRFPFAFRLALELRTCGRDMDSCVMVDPLPLDPLEDAVTPESRETRELRADFLAATRLPLLSCLACVPEPSMSPISSCWMSASTTAVHVKL